MSVTFFIADPTSSTKYEDLDLNLANGNFYDLMMLLDRQDEARKYTGCWELPEIKEILKKIEEVNPSDFVIETRVEGNITTYGRDIHYANRRLSQLKAILVCAHDNVLPVRFG